eukprot:CAMPEP_0195044758 /NCGR_PEP_ID=MMETSP0347-20130606/10879_1 /TAXON_ID=2932 /ORGANISM="Alexandrium fundyense, Strain CCMP1719" /LENGTH=38 /DNA_ID= /DNA_START= /DNA_END= /DNA_ORIENTATION=
MSSSLNSACMYSYFSLISASALVYAVLNSVLPGSSTVI